LLLKNSQKLWAIAIYFCLHFQSLGFCSLIEVIGQPLASLHHADNIRDYTNDLDEIEQD
tara:strand:+ start:315 stop:491 length:177 start_codon:yes stop_codon:yes gene_type:complete